MEEPIIADLVCLFYEIAVIWPFLFFGQMEKMVDNAGVKSILFDVVPKI